ncbi:ribulokinase [Aquimarina sp. U1-2]|uniref:ribulokinase n=1 Tax=Aquimarina sp. U1-2 TaxID=2823141 RepID=UPI001AEC8729|nr:ribulokinase [Aquimarina sp. U1-2]MBP2832897.1 ribulokinase [Aquimarina sp. U1-2]
MKQTYVIGVDFGTDSVRAILVNTKDGHVISSAIHQYARWSKGLYCEPKEQKFRQHPLDHIEGIEKSIVATVKNSDVDSSLIKGICIDTTGSSPIPLHKNRKALALTEDFKENPNAMMILWKDHTAVSEAKEITELAKTWDGPNVTQFVGGVYSSEWYWAKILHISRIDSKVRSAAYYWMEHCDYMTYLLIGSPDIENFKRSRCAAGHKAMWHPQWDGLPPKTFLKTLDPYLAQLRCHSYKQTFTSNQVAGKLCEEWAVRLGLSQDTIVAVGTFDAHAGAVGAGISKNTMVKVMGTSTCDIVFSSSRALEEVALPGICGQVEGAVIPGQLGLEAGQSAFGDVLAWFVNLLYWPLQNIQTDQNITPADIHLSLSKAAAVLEDSSAIPLSIDWINGRRTPDANQHLKAVISQLDLGTQAPHIYKSLVEAICFGAKKILEHFEHYTIEIEQIIGVGGVAKKSPMVMQTLANVLNRSIKISATDQACALGASIYAAVAAGIYSTVEEAIKYMSSDCDKEYCPEPEKVSFYIKKYKQYEVLGTFVEETFG